MTKHDVERIQDGVHGLMEFRGLETIVVEVLRTPEVQRLRKVRQLGLVHYVFPGAEHSRFSHSLGTAHLAIRFGKQVQAEARRLFVRQLVPDEQALADLALAALCHDLGHGPLSHAWEREIVGEGFDRAQWGRSLGLEPESAQPDAKWHEMVGQGLLAWPDGQLHRLLELQEKGRSARIRDLLAGRYYIRYLPRLISGDVDVDRADFIMRDTHHSGVAYGRFDLNWLLSTLTIGRDDTSREWVLGFDRRKSVRVIEQFLIARQAMYDTVYHHKAVRCIEGMVALLLRRLKDLIAGGVHVAPKGIVAPVIRIMQGNAIGPEELIKLDDFVLSVLIDEVADGLFDDDTARDLAQRLQARALFKLVPVEAERIAEFFAVPGNADRLNKTIAQFVPGKPEYYARVDRAEFEMMSKQSERQAMLIDSQANASRAADHETLRQYYHPARVRSRLFTVEAAVEAVERLLTRPHTA